MVKLPRPELRPPARAQQDMAKNGAFDLARSIGTSHASRGWLVELCPLLLAVSKGSSSLLSLTARRYLELFHAARGLAAVEPGHPHQMRHGGASMDALNGATNTSLLDRSGWTSTKSIMRYRKPARYIKCLARLTRPQLQAFSGASMEIVKKMRALVKGL